MFKTTLWISFFAISICWTVGVYNRLVRLRSAAYEARIQLQNTDVSRDGALEIEQYNQAIKQFPASWLAAVFAFKPVIQSDEKKI